MRTREASFLLGISRQRLLVLLAQGRVKGAKKNGRFWKIPVSKSGMPRIIPARRGPEGIWRKQQAKKAQMIHVNQHNIKGNQGKPPEQFKPVVSLKDSKRNDYGYELYISGPCYIVYRPYKPANCGAHVWIETYEAVQFLDTEFNLDPSTARQRSKQLYI